MRRDAVSFTLMLLAFATAAHGQLESKVYTEVAWTTRSTTEVAATARAFMKKPSGEWDHQWHIMLDCSIAGPTSGSNWGHGYGYAMTTCNVRGVPLPAGCYRATASANATDFKTTQTQTAGSTQYCISNPETPPPSTGTQDKCDGLTGYGNPCSPIVINLADGPWRFSGANDAVWFDIDADGASNRITWTAGGEPLAFLAVDRNGNGTIDDGSELFGTATRMLSGDRAPNGFEALRELDANGDRTIDPADSIWSALLLWTDANHDGVSQPQELTRLAQSDVTALRTVYHQTGRTDRAGNELRFMSLLERNGQHRPYYDVFFVSVD